MNATRVLVLAGNDAVSRTAEAGLAHLGEVEMVSDVAEARASAGRRAPDILVVEADRAQETGPDWAELMAACADAAVVVVGPKSGLGLDSLSATEPIRARAPTSADELGQVATQALRMRDLARENERLRASLRTIRACTDLGGNLDPGTVFAETLNLLLEAANRRRGLAHFRRPAMPAAEGLIFRGFNRSESRWLRARLGTTEPLCHGAGEPPSIVADGPLHALLADTGIDEPGSAVVIPLAGEEREAGVIYLFDEGLGFTSQEVEHAAVIAGQAQVALRNAERYQSAKSRALIDDVTGLHNAAYFVDAADHGIERAVRYDLELSVLFIDIDRFKRVNDAYGHLIGSAMLRHVAQCLRDCVRQIDTVVRYGGDEFTMLLTDTSPEAAHKVAERVRDTVARSLFVEDQGSELSVTVSIGIACYPHDSTRRDELVDFADKAMYRAKSAGRDRVARARDLDNL